MVDFFCYDKEVTFWLCDRVTRSSGQITKALYIMDATGVGMFSMDKRFAKALGASSKISENCHPQLVQRQCVINAGKTFKVLFRIASVFMSAKTAERFSLCTGYDSAKAPSGCPYASRWLANPDQELPSFCGGNCTDCNGACVANVPNDFTGKKHELME